MSDVADDITEQYATAMAEAIESATKAEAERDAALARVAELEAKYEPPRPAGNTPIRIVSGRAYLVKVYTKDGNLAMNPVGMDQELVLEATSKNTFKQEIAGMEVTFDKGSMKLKMQGREISFKAVTSTPKDSKATDIE